MEQAFKVFDKNDDGRISKDEMKEVLSDIGIEISETELNDFMKRVDTDGNGTLDYTEFCGIFKDTLIAKVDTMKDLFEGIDKNGDGKIQDTELQEVMSDIFGEEVDLSEAQSVIRVADRDGDGHISFDEFVLMFRTLNIDPDELKAGKAT